MSASIPSLSLSGEAEFRTSFVPRPKITHVVFDFDGTLSWVRHGWPAIMFDVFGSRLQPLGEETAAERRAVMEKIVFGMNGKPTIMQMQRFTEVVQERGGPSLVAESLRQEFQDRLDAEIAARLAIIRGKKAPEDAFVVHGARAVLERLVRDSITPVVLSSSIEHRVKEEAEALGLTGYFGKHIYGSGVDPSGFSKKAVFERLLREEGITGETLLSFGDGPVEIQNTKELGGIAIAVCSDEDHNGSGVMDPIKRPQLLEAGADVAIPDFRDANRLLDYVLA